MNSRRAEEGARAKEGKKGGKGGKGGGTRGMPVTRGACLHQTPQTGVMRRRDLAGFGELDGAAARRGPISANKGPKTAQNGPIWASARRSGPTSAQGGRPGARRRSPVWGGRPPICGCLPVAARAPFHAGIGFSAAVDLGSAIFLPHDQTRQRLELSQR